VSPARFCQVTKFTPYPGTPAYPGVGSRSVRETGADEQRLNFVVHPERSHKRSAETYFAPALFDLLLPAVRAARIAKMVFEESRASCGMLGSSALVYFRSQLPQRRVRSRSSSPPLVRPNRLLPELTRRSSRALRGARLVAIARPLRTPRTTTAAARARGDVITQMRRTGKTRVHACSMRFRPYRSIASSPPPGSFRRLRPTARFRSSEDQTASQPYSRAKMTDLARLKPTDAFSARYRPPSTGRDRVATRDHVLDYRYPSAARRRARSCSPSLGYENCQRPRQGRIRDLPE